MLVIQPIGGKDDWEALFHEAGHTEHYAHTSDDLPTEDKRFGDMAVTEGWAALLEHLVTEPAWLNRRLDVPRPEDLASDGALSLLYFVRRYAAKLLYEIEFFQAPDDSRDAEPLLRDPERFAEDPGQSRELPRRHRRQLLRDRATCARGRSRRSCASSCAPSSATSGLRSATPAISCGSCGRSARGRQPTSC